MIIDSINCDEEVVPFVYNVSVTFVYHSKISRKIIIDSINYDEEVVPFVYNVSVTFV